MTLESEENYPQHTKTVQKSLGFMPEVKPLHKPRGDLVLWARNSLMITFTISCWNLEKYRMIRTTLNLEPEVALSETIKWCRTMHQKTFIYSKNYVWYVGDCDIQNGFSERFFFSNGFYSEGFYSERSFLRTVFSPLIRKPYNPKGHCSKNFNSEMPLFRTVFDKNFFFYSERFLSRTVFDPKGRFSEIRNKNLWDQKPFGSEYFMMSHGTEE